MAVSIQEASLVGVSILLPEEMVPVAIIVQIGSEARPGYHVGRGVQRRLSMQGSLSAILETVCGGCNNLLEQIWPAAAESHGVSLATGMSLEWSNSHSRRL
jgi:hypothetical protein